MMADTPAIDVDNIWRKLGSHGRYQITQLVLLQLVAFSTAWNQLSVIFLGYEPEYWCAAPDNVTSTETGFTMLETEKCSMSGVVNDSTGLRNATFSCLYGYDYSQARKTSIVSEWDLVCEKAVLGGLIQTLYMCGQAFGSVLMSGLADTFGRKTVHIACNVGLLVVNILISVSPHYAMLVILRFFLGGLNLGAYLPSYILRLENFPSEYRVVIAMIDFLVLNGCVTLLGAHAYIFRFQSWRYLQLGIAAASLYSIVEYWFIDESLRWLVAKNKITDAKRLVSKAAKLNGIKPEDVLPLLEERELASRDKVPAGDGDGTLLEQTKNEASATDTEKTKNHPLLQIFRHPKLRIYTICSAFIWIVNAATYYGLFLMSAKLAGDRFVNYLLNAFIEYPATLVTWLFLKYFGRKTTTITFHAIAGASLITASILSGLGGTDLPVIVGYVFSSLFCVCLSKDGRYSTAVTVFVLLGKFGISGSFGVIYLYLPELYPTNVRNLGIGLASGAARVGAMISPFSIYLSEIVVWGPGAIFGACCFIACGLLLVFPETKGKELPQTIEDMSKWEEEIRKSWRQKTETSSDHRGYE